MKKTENLEFVLHNSFYRSVEKNVTKNLLALDLMIHLKRYAFLQVCSDIATAGRHLGLSSVNKNHNLFHQSGLSRDVEL